MENLFYILGSPEGVTDEFLDSIILELGYDALTFDEFKNHKIQLYDEQTDSTAEYKLKDIFTEEELWFYVDPR